MAIQTYTKAQLDTLLAAKLAAADLTAHTSDTSDAHDASAVSFVPTGTVAATDVQAAIAEVASEASGGTAPFSDATALVKDDADATKLLRVDVGTIATSTTRVLTMPNKNVDLAAIPASDVTNTPAGNIAATTVQAAINELDTEKATAASVTDHLNDTTDAHDASAISYAGGTGMSATDVEGAIDELATEKLDTATHYNYETVYFTFKGTLTTTTDTGALRPPIDVAATIVAVRATVGTAPTGSAITIDVHKNGTTIYTTQGNRPTIAVSTNASARSTNMDVTSLAAGDYLTANIDVIGSTVAGADLTVMVRYRYAI